VASNKKSMLSAILMLQFPDFSNPTIWISLLTLTFLEIVLGIDNIIFISIVASKLERKDQARVTNIGMLLAMALRILLLLGITVLISMKEPWFSIDFWIFKGAFSGQSIILILGGIFLLYKSTSEIHHKLEGEDEMKTGAILQMTLINIVFSFDSILTAVGMTTGIQGALVIMIAAVVVSVLIMMLFAVPVGRFVNNHPTIQMLGLSFLILIGFMLIVEGGHMAHFMAGDAEIGEVPKGYLYFAIAFSLLVEFLNIKMRKKQQPVKLRGPHDEYENQSSVNSGQ
jgi:predicted tellurium resistance membrane protein TerC